MGSTAFVGFHSAYVVNDGVTSETSAGNALVGAYLNRIGLPDRAVIYITQAAPQEMTWLTLSDAAQLGIDVEPFALPPENPRTNPPPQPLAPPRVPSLSAYENLLADRLARNFEVRYKSAGLAELNISIPACYEQVQINQKEVSAEYCAALDFLASIFDLRVTQSLKTRQSEFNKYPNAEARARAVLASLNLGERAPELIERAKSVADLALATLRAGPSQASPDASLDPIPSLSGLKIGDPISTVSSIGLAPSAKNRTGPFTTIRWVFPDGNELSVTCSSTGKIVYIESDWGEQQSGVISDFPGLNYGGTTLADLRRKRLIPLLPVRSTFGR